MVLILKSTKIFNIYQVISYLEVIECNFLGRLFRFVKDDILKRLDVKGFTRTILIIDDDFQIK
tara:strand:+ start:82637 stop:82825 length:189 start_codon:yes stop_codon:yes gene_type:complete